jgi:hypothetical protein
MAWIIRDLLIPFQSSRKTYELSVVTRSRLQDPRPNQKMWQTPNTIALRSKTEKQLPSNHFKKYSENL